MLITQYNEFVHRTDQHKERPKSQRRAIALYGLVGEIGSLVSAVKKALLGEGSETSWAHCNEEIIEEIGDVIWYGFSFAQVENDGRNVNILTNDIALLKREIGGENERAKKIHAALDISKKDAFLLAADNLPSTESMTFADYQRIAYLTARTEGLDLLKVCLAVLWQLGAELLRTTLPEIELTLNRNVADRPVNVVLGEIAWHIAAIASLYGRSLDEIAQKNVEKVSYRSDRTQKTPLHDADREESEQFPRQFEVAFVSVGSGRSRMYLGGRRLGDELTDNAYDDDGYRFHDVMHLANAAHLGWSPVLRKLLGRKRKRDSRIDQVEDGARALIVEELVIKAIHSEGVRASEAFGPPAAGLGPIRYFPSKSSIPFRLLKNLRNFVTGLEVQKNKVWEWEDAIFEGAEVFHSLRKEQQGTVKVDLELKKLTFSSDVCVDIKGAISGLGSATVGLPADERDASTVLTDSERDRVAQLEQTHGLARTVASKRAIFDSLGFREPSEEQFQMMAIKVLPGGRVAVKATAEVLQRMWAMRVTGFQLTQTCLPATVCCTAIAVADIQDTT